MVLMLDPRQDAPSRDALAQEARGQIAASGTLKHENTWGLRKMAYEIKKCTEADYRWFRFEAPTDLLEKLDHNLKIADGVLRFRIFKVDPDTPVMVPPAAAAAPPARERGEGDGREAPEAPAETPVAAVEAPAAPPSPEAPAAAPSPEAAPESPPKDAGDGSTESAE
ncbi:MAG: 30S ribosomal protein S6 [Solirubrobacterales bacterium]